MNAAAHTVLVVDDDPEIRSMLADELQRENYVVLEAADGVDLDTKLATARVDLVILDLTLPGEDGLSVCQRLRANTSIPIIVVTARVQLLDRIAGLELGADDYVCKPFEPRELIARVKNILRRTQSPTSKDPGQARRISFGRWTLDVAMRRVVDANERAVILSSTEFRLLRLLIDHAGEVLSREQIIGMGGSHGDDLLARAVDLQISRIRAKLHDHGPPHWIISTVRHQGYSFVAPITCS